MGRLPHVVPTRRLVAMLAATALLWLTSGAPIGLSVSIAITGLVIVAAIADAAATASARAITVERVTPQWLGVGDTADGRYTIRSSWPTDIHVRLFHRIPQEVRAEVTDAMVTVPASSFVDIPLTLSGRGRGRVPLGPVALRVSGPLGLTERTLRFTPDDVMTVAPSIAGIRRYRLLTLQHRLREAGIRTLRLRGGGTSFASLRAYAVGDDPRHIDWKATAKRRQPIVREYTIEQGQTIMILVDAGRMMTQMAGDFPRFEYALSAALTLAGVAVDAGDRVGVMVFADEVIAFVSPQRGSGAVAAIRDALIPVQPRVVEPDYALAFRTLAARQRKRALLVLFSDVIDRRASVALTAHTALSAMRHLPLVVALRNEQLATAALPEARASSSRMYESAAAEELLLAREEALHELRTAGAFVLDVPPAAMAPAVVNRYLELKARAAL